MTFEEMRNNRIGQIFYNNHNEFCEIIEYNNYKDIKIRFNNGYIKTVSLSILNSGVFNNPYTKTVVDEGYLGEGEYQATQKNPHKPTLEYIGWKGVMDRCYSEWYHKKRPTYISCTIDEEWLNFQNFAQWFNENKWDENCTIVDKDILHKGNKIYSPENCVLVDNRINVLFINSKKVRGELPVGVTIHKENKYRARCNIYDKRKDIGVFDTSEEAFYAYKEFKENYIKQVADEYKEKYSNFPQKLYNAMYNWEVEITD